MYDEVRAELLDKIRLRKKPSLLDLSSRSSRKQCVPVTNRSEDLGSMIVLDVMDDLHLSNGLK